MMKVLNKEIRYYGLIGFYIAYILSLLNKIKHGYYKSDRKFISDRFLNAHGYTLNLKNPKSLNEKLQYLKFIYNKSLHVRVSDKFEVRNFLKERFGEEFLIPLIFFTDKPKEINSKTIPDYPVIVKANHDAGNHHIIRDKEQVNWHRLQIDCKWWLMWNYYNSDRELQYKSIKKKIIVEKLLITKEGKIPNDYKLNYINGKLEFVYVSLDREGGNYRNIYDPNWNPLYFKWASNKKIAKTTRGPEIAPPLSFEKMKEFGNEIAKLFPYVRVDFYDVDGKLYFGEITLCHGGGFDRFEPIEKDFEFGNKLILK
jgi:hypothetical protein